MVDFVKKLKEERKQEAAEKLRLRMEKAAGVDKVNLTFGIGPSKDVEDEEPLQDIRDLDVPPAARVIITRYINQIAEVSKTESECRVIRKQLMEPAKAILQKYGLTKLYVAGNKVNFYPSKRYSLNETLLLQHGVSPRTIALCKVPSEGSTLRVTAPGQEEGDY